MAEARTRNKAMKGTQNPCRFPPRRQRGAVAVAFILLVAVLLGFVGLGLDVARLYAHKAELQNASDACALAAAAALTGSNPNQLLVAENYGITTGRRNLTGMQQETPTLAANAQITFSETLGGVFRTRAAVASADVANIRYVRCTLNSDDIPTLMVHLANASPGQDVQRSATAAASAVATLAPSISNCSLPLAICKKDGSSAPNFGYTTGEWLEGRFSPQSGVRGKFKWIEFPGYERVSDLADLLGKGGQCDLADMNTVRPHSGVLNSLVDVWNWRFGVKKNSGAPAGAFPPDTSGYAYTPTSWPAAADAYPDFASRRRINAPWNGVPALGGNWSASTTTVHARGGDRRMVVGPVVDCASWDSGGSGTQNVLGYACYLMLNPVSNPNDQVRLEYRGAAASLASGCVTSGAPGGPDAGGPRVPALAQ